MYNYIEYIVHDDLSGLILKIQGKSRKFLTDEIRLYVHLYRETLKHYRNNTVKFLFENCNSIELNLNLWTFIPEEYEFYRYLVGELNFIVATYTVNHRQQSCIIIDDELKFILCSYDRCYTNCGMKLNCEKHSSIPYRDTILTRMKKILDGKEFIGEL